MMKRWIAVSVIGVLGGCATQETKVSCEGHLQPINAPTATVASPQALGPNAATVTPVISGDT